MNTLKIRNPASGELVIALPADDARSVAVKATAARAAQPAWAALPLADRLACLRAFRAGVVAELDTLATIMTRETGKPIRMSRNDRMSLA